MFSEGAGEVFTLTFRNWTGMWIRSVWHAQAGHSTFHLLCRITSLPVAVRNGLDLELTPHHVRGMVVEDKGAGNRSAMLYSLSLG